jgi:hypothetical protein
MVNNLSKASTVPVKKPLRKFEDAMAEDDNLSAY